MPWIKSKSFFLVLCKRFFAVPAYHLLEEIPQRSPLPHLNALLFDFSRKGELRCVLNLFAEIFRSGEPTDESTFSCTVKACAGGGDLVLGRQLHCCSGKMGLDGHVSVGTSLVDMYMKFGDVEDGRRLFDLMPHKNVVSWSSLLTGYSQNRRQNMVLEMFSQMRENGVKPNAYTFASILTASSSLQALDTGLQAHAQVIKLGFGPASFVCNSLVSMYSKYGLLLDANKVFDEMPYRDSVSWNAMVAGLVQNELDQEALFLFLRMREEGVGLTQSSFAAVMKACGGAGEIFFLRQLHCTAAKKGFTSDVNIRTALIAAYCKSTEMDEAFRLFSSISPSKNIVSWTAIICGYLTNGRPGQATAIFLQMRREGEARANEFTFSAILSAPMISASQIHADAIKSGYETFPSVGTALIKSYGDPNSALRVFSGIENKDLVSYSAMIATFAQSGDSDSAAKLFSEMATQGKHPNEFTLSSLIHSCAAPSAAADQGKQFHAISIKLGFDESVCVSSALITMYSKKGAIESASSIFTHLQNRDLISWNSMLCGYALHGYAHESLHLFDEMQRRGLDPDDVTFVGLLTACTHAGLVQEGRDFFNSMSAPTEEHYACMVDLYSRAGQFDEAMAMLKLSPSPAGAPVWRTLLSKNGPVGRTCRSPAENGSPRGEEGSRQKLG